MYTFSPHEFLRGTAKFKFCYAGQAVLPSPLEKSVHGLNGWSKKHGWITSRVEPPFWIRPNSVTMLPGYERLVL
jgi:hypothetical protein